LLSLTYMTPGQNLTFFENLSLFRQDDERITAGIGYRRRRTGNCHGIPRPLIKGEIKAGTTFVWYKRKEAARPCGFGFSFGSTLPDPVRVWACESSVHGWVDCEVRSRTINIRLCQQHKDSIAGLRSREGPSGALFGLTGAVPRPDSGANTPELARPPDEVVMYCVCSKR